MAPSILQLFASLSPEEQECLVGQIKTAPAPRAETSCAPVWLSSPSPASSDQANAPDEFVSDLKLKISQLEADNLHLKRQREEDANQLKILTERISGVEDRVLEMACDADDEGEGGVGHPSKKKKKMGRKSDRNLILAKKMETLTDEQKEARSVMQVSRSSSSL